MKFNPEDEQTTGPRCRNCHRGSSGCGACHNEAPGGVNISGAGATEKIVDNSRTSIGNLFAAMFAMIDFGGQGAYWNQAYLDTLPYTQYKLGTTSDATMVNGVSQALTTGSGVNALVGQHKSSRTVAWSTGWRQDAGATTQAQVDALCGDDGFSWPHRTLGWKMLKDDLFGLNFDGTAIGVGDTRTYGGSSPASLKAHDIDSVCLDCHNPTIWNATSASDHVDGPGAADDFDDDVLMRGLP